MSDSMALAYLGDAVYEVFVRKRVLELNPGCHVDKLHSEAVKYVRAEAQATVARALMDGVLTDEELTVVKRTRNHKQIASKRIKSSKRGSDPVTDKLATAFEALIGYLSSEGRDERLKEIVGKSFAIIEGDA